MAPIIPPREGVDYPSNLGSDLEPGVEIYCIQREDPTTGGFVAFPHFRRDDRDVPALRCLWLRGICIVTGYSVNSIYKMTAAKKLVARIPPTRKDGRPSKKGRIVVRRDPFLASIESLDEVEEKIEEASICHKTIADLQAQVRELNRENMQLRAYVAAFSKGLP